MKNSIYKVILLFAAVSGIFNACSLDEYNPKAINDVDLAYSEKSGYEGLINSCYVDLYYLYGKIDGIGAMEMGTDLWTNRADGETGYLLYNSNLNTSLGPLKVVWQSLYSTVNLCNTALYFGPSVSDYTSAELKAKMAEAYFMRGWANYHIVEQFGGVVLNVNTIANSAPDATPIRSSEIDFYDQIISDLLMACEGLPVTQTEKGRASKKAAYAMLAKVYLQRTRLGESAKYAKLALDMADSLITKQAELGCALYQSDVTESGFSKLWAGENNKENTEFLFLENVDHVGALNPEGWNRGRTRQYYEADLKTVGAAWGTYEKSLVYGRANSRNYKPTKYLLTSIFEPKEDTPDTRFETSFFYKYYAYTAKTISADLAALYGKDASLVGHKILSSVQKGSGADVSVGNFYASIGWTGSKSYEGFENLENDASLSLFTPNWTIPAEEKALMPCLVNDPSDMFMADGTWVEDVQRKEIYPSLRKFSNLMYCYTEQYHMGDVPIIRLGEIYLVAAEAALLYNNDQGKALTYVNELRKRAAVTSREAEMEVTADKMTVDFILKERARELVGEQVRWYDLKRTGKLNTAYFAQTNPEIVEFDASKHTVRPIPIAFLNAITNPAEFGTNGY